MKNRNIGKPQNLNHPERARFNSSDSFLQLASRDDGICGATLKNVGTPKPVFLTCGELLGLAAIAQRNQAWLEEHAQANREWWSNEIAGHIVLVRLRRRHPPDKQVALSLLSENHLAWYGTPIKPNTPEAKLPSRDQNIQEYPRAEWEEYEERQQISRA